MTVRLIFHVTLPDLDAAAFLEHVRAFKSADCKVHIPDDFSDCLGVDLVAIGVMPQAPKKGPTAKP